MLRRHRAAEDRDRRRARRIQGRRNPSVLLSAGDNFQGSLYYTTYKSKVVSDFLNQMGFDVVATGNHEFDDGPEEFLKFIEAAEFPDHRRQFRRLPLGPACAARSRAPTSSMSAARRSASSARPPRTRPRSPRPAPTSSSPTSPSTSAAPSRRSTPPASTRSSCSRHIGYNDRPGSWRRPCPGIDVIVGGHSPYAALATSPKAPPAPTRPWSPTPMASKCRWSRPTSTASISASSPSPGTTTASSPRPPASRSCSTRLGRTPTRTSSPRSPSSAARSRKRWAPSSAPTTEAIEGSREVCRAMECAMGNLLADAILDRVADQGATIAFQNGGGVRASIDAGEITMGEVLTVLPFSQHARDRADLRRRRHRCAGEWRVATSRTAPAASRRSPGSSTRSTSSKPAGERVSDVQVKGDGDSWVPIDEAATYTIVTNNYVRGGGDGYAHLRRGRQRLRLRPAARAGAGRLHRQAGRHGTRPTPMAGSRSSSSHRPARICARAPRGRPLLLQCPGPREATGSGSQARSVTSRAAPRDRARAL